MVNKELSVVEKAKRLSVEREKWESAAAHRFDKICYRFDIRTPLKLHFVLLGEESNCKMREK